MQDPKAEVPLLVRTLLEGTYAEQCSALRRCFAEGTEFQHTLCKVPGGCTWPLTSRGWIGLIFRLWSFINRRFEILQLDATYDASTLSVDLYIVYLVSPLWLVYSYPLHIRTLLELQPAAAAASPAAADGGGAGTKGGNASNGQGEAGADGGTTEKGELLVVRRQRDYLLLEGGIAWMAPLRSSGLIDAVCTAFLCMHLAVGGAILAAVWCFTAVEQAVVWALGSAAWAAASTVRDAWNAVVPRPTSHHTHQRRARTDA